MPIDRQALISLALAADPRSAYVTRERKGRVAFSNGGTELALARDSCVGVRGIPPAVVAFGARGVSERGQTQMIITCACPASLEQLLAGGLGRDQLAGAQVVGPDGEPVKGRGLRSLQAVVDPSVGRRIVAVIERVYARRVLGTRTLEPRGELARQTLVELLLADRLGRPLQQAIAALRLQLAHQMLARQLRNRRPRPQADWDGLPDDPGPLAPFLLQRLARLGVEQGEDVWLLAPEDLMPAPLPDDVQQVLTEQYPPHLDLGEAQYRLDYDLNKGRVTLLLERGVPGQPPRRQFLPALTGLQIFVEAAGRLHRVG